MLSAEIKIDPRVNRFLRRTRDKARAHAAILRGSSVIVTEARRQITEKGHIITGNLRRDIAVETVKPLVVRVGSGLMYAYFVEMLPDGGFLRPSVQKKLADVGIYVARELMDEGNVT